MVLRVYYLRFENQSFLFYLSETRWKCKNKSITFLFRTHMFHTNNRKSHRIHILQYFTWRTLLVFLSNLPNLSVKCVFLELHCQNTLHVFLYILKCHVRLEIYLIIYIADNTLLSALEQVLDAIANMYIKINSIRCQNHTKPVQAYTVRKNKTDTKAADCLFHRFTSTLLPSRNFITVYLVSLVPRTEIVLPVQ